MDWQLVLLIIFGGLVLLMATGLPVAFAFLLINIIGVVLFWGGTEGLKQLTYSMWFSLASFIYLPIPMFILLGEVVFRSGMAVRAIDIMDKWLGRLPGRLGILTVAMSTMFSTMSGSSIATTAMLGQVLIPEMEKRGYKREISIGSVMGSGGLAMMIPPSSPAVVFASIAGVSVSKILLSGVIPGLIMALFYGGYVIGRCWLQPSVAPAYDVTPTPFSVKFKNTMKYVFPFSFVVFMVTGLIFLGIAGPSEAAAMGVLGAVILAAVYKQLNWKLIRGALISTSEITGMILLILATSQAYSQVLAFTGAAREWVTVILGLSLPPIVVVIAMMIILLILGCFMSGIPIMMICVPLFMPVISALGFSPIWFGLMFLLAIEIGQETPPFGVLIFTMQAVAPKGTTLTEIIKADIPFLICDFLVLAIILSFPVLATWLPDMMLTRR